VPNAPACCVVCVYVSPSDPAAVLLLVLLCVAGTQGYHRACQQAFLQVPSASAHHPPQHQHRRASWILTRLGGGYMCVIARFGHRADDRACFLQGCTRVSTAAAAVRQLAHCCAAVTCLSGWLPCVLSLPTGGGWLFSPLRCCRQPSSTAKSPAPLQAHPSKPTMLAPKPTPSPPPYIVPPSTPHQQPRGHQCTTQMTRRKSAARPSHPQQQQQQQQCQIQ
jgi:hypothetical protein